MPCSIEMCGLTWGSRAACFPSGRCEPSELITRRVDTRRSDFFPLDRPSSQQLFELLAIRLGHVR